ncbi:MAG: hypothetical protein ACRYG4_14980, partial [Janthinobacterium lividum]
MPAEWSETMDYSGDTMTATRDTAAEAANAVRTAAATPADATPAGATAPRTSSTVMPWRWPVAVDRSRDALLTDFGRETLKDRYLLPGES